MRNFAVSGSNRDNRNACRVQKSTIGCPRNTAVFWGSLEGERVCRFKCFDDGCVRIGGSPRSVVNDFVFRFRALFKLEPSENCSQPRVNIFVLDSWGGAHVQGHHRIGVHHIQLRQAARLEHGCGQPRQAKHWVFADKFLVVPLQLTHLEHKSSQGWHGVEASVGHRTVRLTTGEGRFDANAAFLEQAQFVLFGFADDRAIGRNA